jgi:hypothetical protein
MDWIQAGGRIIRYEQLEVPVLMTLVSRNSYDETLMAKSERKMLPVIWANANVGAITKLDAEQKAELNEHQGCWLSNDGPVACYQRLLVEKYYQAAFGTNKTWVFHDSPKNMSLKQFLLPCGHPRKEAKSAERWPLLMKWSVWETYVHDSEESDNEDEDDNQDITDKKSGSQAVIEIPGDESSDSDDNHTRRAGLHTARTGFDTSIKKTAAFTHRLQDQNTEERDGRPCTPEIDDKDTGTAPGSGENMVTPTPGKRDGESNGEDAEKMQLNSEQREQENTVTTGMEAKDSRVISGTGKKTTNTVKSDVSDGKIWRERATDKEQDMTALLNADSSSLSELSDVDSPTMTSEAGYKQADTILRANRHSKRTSTAPVRLGDMKNSMKMMDDAAAENDESGEKKMKGRKRGATRGGEGPKKRRKGDKK